MKFSLDGRSYEVAIDLSIGEARAVKRHTGLSVTQLLSLPMSDADVAAALVWVAKRRAGEEITWDDVDQLDLITLVASIEYDAPAEDQGDPDSDTAEPGADNTAPAEDVPDLDVGAESAPTEGPVQPVTASRA